MLLPCTPWASAWSGRANDRRWSAYGATIAVIAVLCVVVVGHDLLRTWQDRNHQLENSQREVANLVWAAEQHTNAAFLLADTILAGLAERVAIDGTDPPQLVRLRSLMAQRLANSPVLQSLSLIDEDGALIASGRPVPEPVALADRVYFQYHKTNVDPRPYVSSVLRARITGKLIISLSIRLNHPDGSFAGVAAASVETGYFQAFYASLDLGHDGLASLYRDDGTLLVRHPFLEAAVGVNSAGTALFRDLLPKAPQGTFESVSTFDGTIRIVSYRRVTGYPLLVLAALGKDEQLAVWRTGAAEHLLATLVVAVLLGFIGLRLVGQVRWLTHAEQATAAARAAARIAAAQYQLIADNASDMIVTLDMRLTCRYVSPSCRELVGYEPEELIDGTPFSLALPEDTDRVNACLRGMAAGRDRDLLTFRMRHRDGKWIWVEASLRLIRDPDNGTPREICGALRDITHRMSVQAALRERERELERSNADLRELKVLNVASQYARSLLEASLDPMVAISPAGTITDVNEATIQATGISRTNLIGTGFSDYFTEPERARRANQRVLADGSVRDYPLTIRHRDETWTEVMYNASIYKDGDGIVLGVFAAARDVTAQKRVEVEIGERRAIEHERLEELERFQRLTIGRELKMIELKREIEELKKTEISTVAE
jgi:PAS domain S-box-containing protein